MPERAIPAEVLAAPTPSEQEARKALLEIGARVLGVGTVGDLTNYFMLNIPKSRAAIDELVEDGVLVPTTVEGWKEKTYRHRDARVPRKVSASALLTPFDNLVWRRQRDEQLFDFHYRIEIYTPAPEACVRLLRAALPARRDDRGPRRREGRSQGEDALGAGRIRGAGSRRRRGRKWRSRASSASWRSGSASTA